MKNIDFVLSYLFNGNTRSVKDNDNWKELLFFTGFIIYLARGVWATTMFPFPRIISKLCFGLAILFIGLKILLYDRYPFRRLICIGIMALDSLLVIYSSHYLNIFFWVLLILGAKDISFKKILQIYLIITISIMALAFIASMTGVIENLKYVTDDRGVRQAFGCVYTTDFSSHIFYIALVIFYLKGNRLHWFHYVALIVIAGLVYHFCNTRLDCISMVLTALLFGIGNYITQGIQKPPAVSLLWNKLWSFASPWIMPAFAALSFFATLSYNNGESAFWSKVNSLITGRLSLCIRGIRDYGFTFFGQKIDMIGAGSTTIFPDNYFFIDCSYILVCLRYGVIALFLLLIVYSLSCIKNKKDIYFLYAITLVSINCVIAHHILELEYNPFALALLSQCVRPVADNFSCSKQHV